MVFTLLSHQWKELLRSRNAGKNIIIQIFTAIGLLYFLLMAIAFSVFLPKILNELFPGQNIVTVFCGFILYYFAFDIILRFMMQELPMLAVQPYLVQNIRHRQLVNFLNLRSIFSFFNLLPFILFIPFIVSQIGAEYGPLVSFSFALAIIALCAFNHFLILFIKRKTGINSWWLAGFFVLVLLIIGADYFGIFSMQKFSAALFTTLLKAPWYCIVIVALAIMSYYNNQAFLLRNFYIEEKAKSARQKTVVEYNWLKNFGDVGELIELDLKLILRNKRPRSLLLISFIFLFYGFMFYKAPSLDANKLGGPLIGAMFITGMCMTSYGQFLFAWQSNQFDGLMTSNINLRNYIKSKFILLNSFSTVTFLLSLFYAFLSWKIIPIQVAAFIFNIGINAIGCIYFATRNYKALDLSKVSTYNYQGTGASQYVYSISIMLIGLIIYLPFALLINPWAGVIAIGTIGLINFLLREWWIDILTRQFTIRKYRILEGFREK